jgi:hypothetical protein
MIWTFRENIRNTTLFGRIDATEFRNICYFWVDRRNRGKMKIDAILRIFGSCAKCLGGYRQP